MGKRLDRMSDEADLESMIIFNLIDEKVVGDSKGVFKYMRICHEEVHFDL